MYSSYSAIDFLISSVLAIIMMGIGLSLSISDFKKLFNQPLSLIIALAVQLFIIPVIAYVIASVSDCNASEKVGIVIVSLCASGASSNLITHLFKGNVALAISMTSINSFITLLSIPLLANLTLNLFMGVDARIQLPVPETITQIFVVTIIPAAIGVYIRSKRETAAKLLEKPLKYVLTFLLFVVFTIKIFFSKQSGGTGISLTETLQILPYMLVLNFMAMAVGILIAKLFRRNFIDQFTISIEVGLHNTALALLIGGTILKNPEIEKPAVVYAMFSFFTAVVFIFLVKQIHAWFEGKKKSRQ